jgi:hypothetical protein
MLSTSFTTSTYTLWRPDNTQVPASPSYNAATNTATITPTLPLNYGTTYTVKLTTGVMDSANVPLAAPVSWTFTTTTTMITKRINVGSSVASYTSTATGNTWTADANFKNGLIESFPSAVITFPQAGTYDRDPNIFRDDRYGSSTTALWSYNIPIPNGTYDIKLYFVELTKTAIGQRVFSVDLTDTAVNPDIANLDIFQAAGGQNNGYVVTLPNIPIADSTVTLRSIAVTDLPEIAAIEIIPIHP